ncbi:MAG: hypothetical protein A2847_00855 [Candidatus Sungbacteria bacterium RIFCSPHIGHO2_01_FULL_50_25]|uniref:Ribosomal RNA methyltransferase FtsJ domain-containing protein n=1 Tax=Candidatus Sungbacteria bacterium RIFCSPHIGHO2_01_FULL_50_25 TaxID=1802265 RepID=A0A1G2KB15_9BACT|nr:MAG: hypothetical protein A2847_00855 [Candidatus Sungbacteria bacterium RIFCSPHIGHO2_01_FULL_50_25]
MKKKRLDDILIERGTVEDRQGAFIVVTEGNVFVGGQKAVSGAQMVDVGADIRVRESRAYVGRGAYKLEAAIKKFETDAQGKVCLDIGAATGGFTEVLLNHGAKKVYAVDTAKGKMALKLREDPRVVLIEGTDIRALKKLPEEVKVATIDVSLIPLQEILPHVKRFLADTGEVIALLKPQYETRDPKILRHGVIKNTRDRKRVLDGFLRFARDSGWDVRDYIESPIRGSKGNVEYLIYLRIA